MTIDELIKILENYEVFVDDDYGGSYKSVIAYAPDKKVSRAHTPIGTLKIIDTFEEIQKENQELKKRLAEISIINVADHKYASECEDKVITMESQQKEFIEWLESNLEVLEMCDRELILTNNKKEIKVYKEVLSKYKEIIGGKHE